MWFNPWLTPNKEDGVGALLVMHKNSIWIKTGEHQPQLLLEVKTKLCQFFTTEVYFESS